MKAHHAAHTMVPALVLVAGLASAAPAPAPAEGARLPPAPARIAKTERIEGLALERRDEPGEDGARWSQIGDDGAPDAGERGGRRCFQAVGPGDSLRLRPSVGRLVRGSRSEVVLVRSERFRLDDDKNAHLDREDFWFDPRTLGARVLARSSVDLAPLATNAAGVIVYGYRDGSAWHLVLPTPSNATLRDVDAPVATTSCGHARVRVDASAPGGGSTAAITLQLAQPLTPVTLGAIVDGVAAQKQSGPSSITVSASASRLSRDPDPVLSIHVTYVTAPHTPDISAFAELAEDVADVE